MKEAKKRNETELEALMIKKKKMKILFVNV